jgi:GTP-binding protein
MSEKEGGLKIYDAHKDQKVAAFEVLHLKAHYWKIQGEKVEKDYALINLSTDEGIKKLIDYLDKIGVEDKLKEEGAIEGDTVAIGDFEFEYSD